MRRSLNFIEPIFLGHRRGISRREGSHVRLDESLPIPTGERLAWERMLNRHLNACGCVEGSVGLLIGVAVALAAYLVRSEAWSAWEVGAACVLPLALLAGGQTIGRRRGRVRFQEAVGRLLSRLRIAGIAPIPKSAEPPIGI